MQKKMLVKFFAVPMALLGLAMAPGISRADIVISQGNNPQPDEANVLINTPNETGTTIQGATNTNPPVTFFFTTNAGQTLLGTQANGQAVVNATNGTTVIPLQGVTMNLAFDTNLGLNTPFTDLIFNTGETGNPPADATFIRITVNSIDSNNVAETPTVAWFNIGNGSNFQTSVALNGEHITSVSFDFVDALSSNTVNGTAVSDLKQVRISGVVGTTPVPPPVPEPSTMAIAGLGALGFVGYGLRRRLKK